MHRLCRLSQRLGAQMGKAKMAPMVSPVGASMRSLSDSRSLVETTLDPSTGIAEITMQNMPVNSLSLEMMQALTGAIQQAESDPKMQALILQSGSSSIFSAGLDLMELHQPQPDRLRDFWRSFQDLYLALYGSRLSCIAAIQGHAPAAGCMLALSCDYRIMASTATDASKPPPTIGLNESKLGIAAPSWLAQQMMDTIGIRQAELALALGTLYTPEQALHIQLVDAVVAPDQVRPTALAEAKRWCAIPPQARVASKQLVRQGRLDALRANMEPDLNHFVGFVTHPKAQKNLSAYLEMLAKKKK